MEKYKTEEKIFKFEDIDLSGTYSYANYLKWEFEERVELIKGKIFTMSPGPSTMHQRVSMRLGAELYNFLQGKICEVFAAPFDVRLSQTTLEDQSVYTVVSARPLRNMRSV